MTAPPSAVGVTPATATSWKQAAWLLVVDASWLIVAAIVVLAIMSLLVGTDAGDWRVHGAIVAFLLPGWWLAPRALERNDGLAQRLAAATIISFGFHGVVVAVGSRMSLSFDACYGLFAIFLSIGAWLRCAEIRQRGFQHYRIHATTAAVVLAATALVCVGWRNPESNDVPQFLPNQIDMAAVRTLAPSPIGMTAFGIDEPMPRWKAHTWHVWFSRLADVTRLPVEGIAYRWATVPVALLAFVMLAVCLRELTGVRPPAWAIVLAIVGPITLWFRSYNAYVYAFRAANNLCLDKDFALLWLVPAWLWVFSRAVRSGDRAMWCLLTLLMPLLFGIHPMTPTYLLLLLPFAVIASLRPNRRGLLRAAVGAGVVVVLFVVSLRIGEAQAAHRQIEQLVHLDAERHFAEDRPLHYWPGHYATVPELTDMSGTIVRDGGALRLNPTLITGCSLLLVMPLAIAIWITLRLLVPGAGVLRRDWQPVIAVLSSIAVLGVIFLASGWFLSRAPHLYRGFERLHWFCYVPALVSLGLLFTQASRVAAKLISRTQSVGRSRRNINRLATVIIILHLGEQVWHVRTQSPTVLHDVRGLNSLWDYYSDVGYNWIPASEPRWSAGQPVVPLRPEYLREDDRVLPLVRLSPSQYHELRQSIWWAELYGEGHMLLLNGEAWLNEWQTYYDVVDGVVSAGTDEWIRQRDVTIILDNRPGADDVMRELSERLGTEVSEVAPGVWRIGESR